MRRSRRVGYLLAAVLALAGLILGAALLIWPFRDPPVRLSVSYRMSFDNLTYNIRADGSLSGLIVDGRGAVTGSMTVNPPLGGTGPLTGTLSGRSFGFTGALGGNYAGTLSDDGSLVGRYRYGAASFTGQHGTWHAEPRDPHSRNHSGLPHWLWFGVALLLLVALGSALRASRAAPARRP